MKHPFITLNNFNVRYVKLRTFRCFLNHIGYNAYTKKQFLEKYYDYSCCICKEKWLNFLRLIADDCGILFDYEYWSCQYDEWESKGKSYSLYFI